MCTYAWSNITSFSGGVAPTVIQDLRGEWEEVVNGRCALARVITCSAIYEISMELHQLREVAPASPRSSLSISLEIVRSCCISMGISGTVRRHEFRGGFANRIFQAGLHFNCSSVRYHTSLDKFVKLCELSVLCTGLPSPWVSMPMKTTYGWLKAPSIQ